MEHRLFELMQATRQTQELAVVSSCNEKSEAFGLALTEEQARELVVSHHASLASHRRVEFGYSILKPLIFTFCDSPYVDRDNYLDTLKRLQDIFYEYKSECGEELTDEELLNFMREQFDQTCHGNMDYLETTCLERFARKIRSGYKGFHDTEGYGEYEDIDEDGHWDKAAYYDALARLFE